MHDKYPYHLITKCEKIAPRSEKALPKCHNGTRLDARFPARKPPAKTRIDMTMIPAEVREHLQLLGLNPVQAARMLGVGLRTMRRWTDIGEPEQGASAAAQGRAGQGADIPGPAEQALRAWLRLHRLGLSWRPGPSF